MPPRAARLQQNKSRASPAISVDNGPRNVSGTSALPPASKKRNAAAAGVGDGTAGPSGSSKRKRTDNANAVAADDGSKAKATSSNVKGSANGTSHSKVSGDFAGDEEESEEGRSTVSRPIAPFRPSALTCVLSAVVSTILINPTQMDFKTLPLSALQAYVLKYDLLPTLAPYVVPPASTHMSFPPAPPLPYHMLEPSLPPPPPVRSLSPTPANRPRRRRSTRLGDENGDAGAPFKEPYGNPVLSDLEENRKVLAEVAKRHWEHMQLKEVEVMDSFSFSLRFRGELVCGMDCSMLA